MYFTVYNYTCITSALTLSDTINEMAYFRTVYKPAMHDPDKEVSYI